MIAGEETHTSTGGEHASSIQKDPPHLGTEPSCFAATELTTTPLCCTFSLMDIIKENVPKWEIKNLKDDWRDVLSVTYKADQPVELVSGSSRLPSAITFLCHHHIVSRDGPRGLSQLLLKPDRSEAKTSFTAKKLSVPFFVFFFFFFLIRKCHPLPIKLPLLQHPG